MGFFQRKIQTEASEERTRTKHIRNFGSQNSDLHASLWCLNHWQVQPLTRFDRSLLGMAIDTN